MSFACNNIKLTIQNDTSEVICATCKQCLITANHDECVFKYVNNMNSSKKNQSDNVSESAIQKKHKANAKKSKKLGSIERLASPRPSKPRTCLRWLPTRRIFDLGGKITESSNTESKSDTLVYETPKEEYVSLSACCALALWMWIQLTNYGSHFDSKSAIAISYNPVHHSRSNLIAVCFHSIKMHVEKGTTELYFVKTDHQLADIFTKDLPVERFIYLVRHHGMRSLSLQELKRLVKSQ
ncbi:hypothetical protein Tco_1094178 [Tanacetum coccineum]|uniref:Retrovirus-related Pol polyprotein from transposon TNT 1-94 n=1 Tax=Tanacetum coccineum TaxID=301880 RepID=A0ABQ5IEU8_9ASTR